jgi:hypothetical protein
LLRCVAAADELALGIPGLQILGNAFGDPALERPEFVEVRRAIAERLDAVAGR